MIVIGINIVGIMMLLRVRALYSKRMIVVCGLASLLAVEFGVNAWLLTHGIPVPHKGPRHPCTMVFDQSLTKIAPASAWLPLLYDTVVIAITAYKVYQSRSLAGYFQSPIPQTILAGGVVYYSVIFSITLTLTIMIAVAPAGIQNITAQLELLLTVTMMSRITIDLKKHGKDHVRYTGSKHVVTADEYGPYCYQLCPRPPRTSHGSVDKRNSGNPDLEPGIGSIFVGKGETVNEIHDLVGDQYYN